MSYYQIKYIGHGRKPLKGRGKAEQTRAAYLASVSYGENQAARDEKLRKFGLSDWAIDNDLSTPDIAVIRNDKTKEIAHSIAGTRPKSIANRWRDARSDLGIIMGTDRYGKRTAEVKAVVDAAKKKYVDYSHEAYAHSLGGKVASNISKETGLKATVFNKGSSPLSSVVYHLSKLLGRDHQDSKITHYTTNRGSVVDPLSLSTTLLGNDDVTEKWTRAKGPTSSGLLL
jgi:hypothetical protein